MTLTPTATAAEVDRHGQLRRVNRAVQRLLRERERDAEPRLVLGERLEVVDRVDAVGERMSAGPGLLGGAELKEVAHTLGRDDGLQLRVGGVRDAAAEPAHAAETEQRSHVRRTAGARTAADRRRAQPEHSRSTHAPFAKSFSV